MKQNSRNDFLIPAFDRAAVLRRPNIMAEQQLRPAIYITM
jgi:hypothetical protein